MWHLSSLYCIYLSNHTRSVSYLNLVKLLVLVFAVLLCFQWEQHVHNQKQIHSQDMRKNNSAGSDQTSPGTGLWKVRLWCYPGMILSVCTVTIVEVAWVWWFCPTFKADSSFLSWSLPSVVTNSSTYYLNTIANSQEFSLFKIVFQWPTGVNYFNSI